MEMKSRGGARAAVRAAGCGSSRASSRVQRQLHNTQKKNPVFLLQNVSRATFAKGYFRPSDLTLPPLQKWSPPSSLPKKCQHEGGPGLTFPNVKNDAAASTKAQKSPFFFFGASPAFGRRRFHPLPPPPSPKKNTDFFVLYVLGPGVVRRSPPGPPQTDILLGGGVPPLPSFLSAPASPLRLTFFGALPRRCS